MIKKHNYYISKNGIDEGIYFIKKEEAKNYIKECKKRQLQGNYKIIKL